MKAARGSRDEWARDPMMGLSKARAIWWRVLQVLPRRGRRSLRGDAVHATASAYAAEANPWKA